MVWLGHPISAGFHGAQSRVSGFHFPRCPPTHPQALAAGPEAGGLGPCTPDAQQDWPEMANLSPTKACDLRFSGSPAWPPAPHGLLWAPAHLLQPRFYRRGT